MNYNAFRQSFCLPKPALTGANCPDQTGRVHVVTGGYGGVGLKLAEILYQHNARVYIAGRSPEKANKAVQDISARYPKSTGTVEVLIVDFGDLTTIKAAVDRFTAKQQDLHVLTLNHGIMFTPTGARAVQGNCLQLTTNCLGSYLFYKLLRATLVRTAAKGQPGAVRVSWAGSMAIDMYSPSPGGILFEKASNTPQMLDSHPQYGQSKVGNMLLAAVLAREDAAANVMHLCFNPGNLNTDL
ncbi:hypothetical protein LTR36_009470 [Oleoguttula mirabilis]|uniref:NAD(P)-binding protein n=1 Tax=Oleoguttula mirabilis TaxID=1507867 RepID=A0AAV9JSC6_9PEZI|nr:hypothetical protein LTR36_009470 [Oleoguttula mirabilis]